MKYKVGDKIRFVKDYKVGTGEVIPVNSVWEVKSVLEAHYRLEPVAGKQLFALMIEHKIAEGYCEIKNTAPSITKRINNKHDILNGLLQTDGSIDGEKLMETLESDLKESEKAINLLREMKHNCEHANKYDDPKRHDKAKALGFAIELIEHDCSAVEYKPEKLMEKLESQSDSAVKHPSHYTQGIECYKYINSHNSNFNAGCIIKYATRYLLKGKPIEDLRKVQQYAEYEIERLKALGYKE